MTSLPGGMQREFGAPLAPTLARSAGVEPFTALEPGAIGVATLPLDRFVGLQANRRGTLLTRPFKLEGTRLTLNAKVPEGGRLHVAVLDAAGKVLPGFSAEQSISPRGDHLEATIAWGKAATLKSLAGRTVRLKFHFKNATLFAFRVR